MANILRKKPWFERRWKKQNCTEATFAQVIYIDVSDKQENVNFNEEKTRFGMLKCN
jgi:hypothetical protein